MPKQPPLKKNFGAHHSMIKIKLHELHFLQQCMMGGDITTHTQCQGVQGPGESLFPRLHNSKRVLTGSGTMHTILTRVVTVKMRQLNTSFGNEPNTLKVPVEGNCCHITCSH
mmetsp:Transcript_142046/g.247632  ORF Transcript_142046/g.247632 Transcript_142046/m.247632 type:complete len:112 (-) Transcript_142046:1052-1387(-)